MIPRCIRTLASAAAVYAIAVPSALPDADAQDASSLSTRLGALLDEADLGDAVGVHVIRVSDGHPIFRRHENVPRNPASNIKLITAAAALLTLGPDFTVRTALIGNPEGARVDRLVLRGFGDPSLRLSTLSDLAQGLVNRGINSVGTVVVDGSYFDDEFLPPAFEQQPNELAAFRAAVAAVSVDRSSYILRVLPAAEVGQAADLRLSVPDYFSVEGAIRTGAAGAAPNVIVDHDDGAERMTLRVDGTVPLGAREVAYRLRVNHPLYFAGEALVTALERVGISTDGVVRLGRAEGAHRVLVQHRSEPLANLVDALGKRSDNFTAEMILKILGAQIGEPGTSAAGLRVVSRRLREAGVEPTDLELVNGSGLFVGNRVAPSHFTRILRHMHSDPSVRSEYIAHLAAPGETGTLSSRLRDLAHPRVVRAKTGTLRDAVALSGYVLHPSPAESLAFSVLLNGVAGRVPRARRLTDDIVRELVRQPRGSPEPEDHQ